MIFRFGESAMSRKKKENEKENYSQRCYDKDRDF